MFNSFDILYVNRNVLVSSLIISFFLSAMSDLDSSRLIY